MRANDRVKLLVAVAGLATLGWMSACLDDPVGPEPPLPPPPGLVVSDPVLTAASGAAPGGTRSALVGAEASVVYVSLLPGTEPRGVTATVRALTSDSTLTTPVRDGGFDPVPVVADVGDTIEVVVRDGVGAIVLPARIAVARVRRPIVVRTDPPPKKRDVPLNSVIVVVFSEPIDPATLSGANLYVLAGQTSIGGRLAFTDPADLTASFVPEAPLRSGTDYRLVVTQGILDLDGDALEAPVTVAFTTAAPVASVALDRDTATIAVGDTLALHAQAVDSAGNPLADRPIAWSSSDSGVAGVSSTGVVRGRARGSALIIASAEGKADSAAIAVTGATIDLETYPDGSPTCDDCALADQFATYGIVFSSDALLQRSANNPTADPANHHLTAPTWQGGAPPTMSFFRIPRRVSFHSRVDNAVASYFVTAFDASGYPIPAALVTFTDRLVYTPCESCGPFRQELVTVTSAGGISRIEIRASAVVLVDDINIAPSAAVIDFESLPDGSAICPLGCDITDQFAARGVTFSFTANADSQPRNASICDGSRLDPAAYGAHNHAVTGATTYPCPPGGTGLLRMTFNPAPTTVVFMYRQVLSGRCGVAAFGADGGWPWISAGGGLSYITRDGAPAEEVSTYVTHSGGIASVILSMVGCEAAVDNVLITGAVTPPPPVASVTVAPESASIVIQQSLQLSATVRDVNGVALLGRAIAWTSSDPSAATVDSTGLVRGVAVGSALIVASVEGKADTAAITVTTNAGIPTALVAAVATWTDVSGVGAWGVVNAPIEYYVAATDAGGNGVRGVTLDWVVTSGGGSVTPARNATADSTGSITFPQPVAWATHTLGSVEGVHTVTVTANGVPGAPQATLSTRAVHGLVGLDQWTGFNPSDISVPVGTTVAWIWNDGCCPAEHDVTFVDDASEPASSPGKTDPAYHTRTFTFPGTYRYRCTRHSQNFAVGEVGSVTVVAAPVPAAGRIAFEGDGIDVINPDGSGLATLADGYHPAWSPDATRISFVRSQALYVMDQDGSNVQFVHDGVVEPGTSLSGGVWQPAWSPDGTRIAFAFDFMYHDGQFVQEAGNIGVVNADGSGARTLLATAPAVWYWYPTWSPDGTRIAFLRQNAVEPQFELMIVGADGSGLIKLAENAGSPAWSPDGTRIAFHGNPGSCDQGGTGRSCGIYVMNADGTGIVQLLADTVDLVHPTWSPDGSKIAFARWVDDVSQYDLYVMNSDGSGVTRLTNRPGFDWYPKWSPVHSGTPTSSRR